MYWSRLLQIIFVLAGYVALTSLYVMYNRRDSNTVKPKQSKGYLEMVNKMIAHTYKRSSYLDSRLEVLKYTILPDPLICQNATFLVIVHVRADDAKVRNSWRRTYGSKRMKEKFNYRLIFAIGKGTLGLQHDRKIEGQAHGDILQVDYLDSYHNLTFKHLAALRYVASMCRNTKGVLKLDDDVAWNVEKISSYINNNLTKDGIYCYRRPDVKPDFTPSKWKVSRSEWNETYYPTHCLGIMYITTISTVQRLLGVVHTQKFLWIDDVFITGVLSKASKVDVVALPNIFAATKHPESLMEDMVTLIEKRHIDYWFVVNNLHAVPTDDEKTSN